MVEVTREDRKIVSINGVIATVVSALIAAGILGGISLGRSDAGQTVKIEKNRHHIESVELRIDRERARTEQELADLKGAVRDLSLRQAQDTGELRSLLLQILSEVNGDEK